MLKKYNHIQVIISLKLIRKIYIVEIYSILLNIFSNWRSDITTMITIIHIFYHNIYFKYVFVYAMYFIFPIFFFIFLIKFSNIRLYANYIIITYIETFYYLFTVFYLNLTFLS